MMVFFAVVPAWLFHLRLAYFTSLYAPFRYPTQCHNACQARPEYRERALALSTRGPPSSTYLRASLRTWRGRLRERRRPARPSSAHPAHGRRWSLTLY